MVGFITNTIDNPWTGGDMYEFEENGSQRDPVQYNSYYNLRIKLTDKNIFLCTLKTSNGDYKNIYLFAAKRNLFYFAIFVPQLEILKQIKNNSLIAKVLQSLPLSQKCLNSENKEINLEKEVLSLDGSCLLVKVNAPIDSLLYPRNKQISNIEIKQKYAFLNNLYFQIEKEYDGLLKVVGEYNAKVEYKIEDIKNRLRRILVRKGVRIGVSIVLSGITGGLSAGLDTLFGLDDIADVDDLLDMADMTDLMGEAIDNVDVAGILDADILDFEIDDISDINMADVDEGDDLLAEGHNVSFGKSDKQLQKDSDYYNRKQKDASDRIASSEKTMERSDISDTYRKNAAHRIKVESSKNKEYIKRMQDTARKRDKAKNS